MAMASDMNFEREVLSEQGCEREAAAKKPWHAPQLETVSIAGLTEHSGNPGNDGGGTSTLS